MLKSACPPKTQLCLILTYVFKIAAIKCISKFLLQVMLLYFEYSSESSTPFDKKKHANPNLYTP